MRDLVTPATLAWEREGDLEAQGKEQQSWRGELKNKVQTSKKAHEIDATENVYA